MLTIGQLAAYAGVTVRAVRHYHATGLLREPERDHSGYRRYDAAAVVELIRIRTLAEAGVPLSRVQELLGADDEEFAVAVEDIDRRLRTEMRQLQEHRHRIAQLAAGDSLALPPEAVGYLARLRELDLPEGLVGLERDAWILVAAQMPEQMPSLMALKLEQLNDPAVIALYGDLVEALDWPPGDRRLDALADRLAMLFEAAQDEWEEHADDFPLSDELVELLDSVFLANAPFAPRLLALLEARGWKGWTRIERIDSGRG
jgi:DNA-binding transcriptional MerR regulator